MAGKGLIVAATAGAGALATIGGIYLLNKMKNALTQKPKMKLFHKHLFLSTRCTWLISELGAESEFELVDDDAPLRSAIQGTGVAQLSSLHPDPDHPAHSSHGGEAAFQVVEYKRKMNEDDSDYDEDYYLDYDDPRPPGMLPALVVNDDFTMIEGTAICLYLADLYQQFLPDHENKAEYYSWIIYSAATFDNIMKTLQHQMVDTPENRQDPDILHSALKGFHAFARALSSTLEKKDFICGDRFTAADCVLGFTLWWAYTIDRGNLLQEHPVLLQYLDKLKTRPAFRKTFGDEETWDWGRFFPTYLRGTETEEEM